MLVVFGCSALWPRSQTLVPLSLGASLGDAAVAESVPKAESAAAAAAQLDTGSADRIESFLRGVEEALAEARAALAILERHPR